MKHKGRQSKSMMHVCTVAAVVGRKAHIESNVEQCRNQIHSFIHSQVMLH